MATQATTRRDDRFYDRYATPSNGALLVTYALALIFIWFGCLKFIQYEAAGIAPLVMNSPLVTWWHGVFGIAGTARMLGVYEILTGLLLAARPVNARLAAIGGAMATICFLTTITFMFSTPGVVQSGFDDPLAISAFPGQFLLKDVVLLAVSIWILFSARAEGRAKDLLRARRPKRIPIIRPGNEGRQRDPRHGHSQIALHRCRCGMRHRARICRLQPVPKGRGGRSWRAAASTPSAHPVVVELFQSQGCSSCPPANANVNAIAARPDVLALSFAVTYWDQLGWKDSFGSPRFTARQWDYARHAGRPEVATPQVIINGGAAIVGSNAQQLDATVAKAGPARGGPELAVEGATLHVGNGRPASPATIWLVRYDPRTIAVPIRAGENGGKTLPHRNIVRELVKLGGWTGAAATLRIPTAAGPGLASAVLVQSGAGGPIIAARKL